MKMFEHQQLHNKVINQLQTMKDEVGPDANHDRDTIRKMQTMINELKLSQYGDLWEEFESYFLKLNPEYLRRLSKKFPNLTPNDLRLCIFLYLDMRTKDISMITHQSVKSIEVARTRLRNKLNLSNTQTKTSAFLKQI